MGGTLGLESETDTKALQHLTTSPSPTPTTPPISSSVPLPPLASIVILTGTPLCTYMADRGWSCLNRSMPGSDPPLCGSHGGKLMLRPDRTLGVIGPGTTKAICRLTGLDRSWVTEVLTGRGNPSARILMRIAEVVGFTVDDLIRYIAANSEYNSTK